MSYLLIVGFTNALLIQLPWPLGLCLSFLKKASAFKIIHDYILLTRANRAARTVIIVGTTASTPSTK